MNIKINIMNKRFINTFTGHGTKLNFGDYILFQIYKQDRYENDKYQFKISKPILAIYLGYFVADQALGFNYVVWNNDNHIVRITNEYVTNYPTTKQVDDIKSHIEWNDRIDILDHWDKKPEWKEIIVGYRQQNLDTDISEDDFEN